MVVDEKQIVLEVVEEISHQLSPNHPTPTPSTELEVELGLGSLERLELVKRLEQRLGRTIEEQPIFTARYVSDLLIELSTAEERGPLGLAPRPMPEPLKEAESLLETLAYHARVQPAEAVYVLLEQDREVAMPSYAELLSQARRVSSGLQALGVEPGDRVALMLSTGPDFFPAFFGVLNAGAIAVPLYPPLRMDQFEDFLTRQDAILSNCQAKVLITLTQMTAVAEVLKQRTRLKAVTSVRSLSQAAPAPVYPAKAEEVVMLQYTSGSTGDPKGVPLTNRNLLVNIWAMGKGWGVASQEIMVSWLPLYHDMGLIGMCLVSFVHGIPLVLMAPAQFASRPVRWLRAFSDYRGTMTAAPNFAYAICAKKLEEKELTGLDLSSWRMALNGAEPVIPSTVRTFNQRFAPYGFRETTMFPAYGLAEATLAVSLNPLERGMKTLSVDRDHMNSTGEVVEGRDEVVSCGPIVDDMEVRIVSETGAVLPDAHQGQVEIRGASVMGGYFGYEPAPEWLRVGDLAFMLEGELYITGRTKDLIVVGGRNLHPNDVEAIVGQVKGVRPGCVAAIGVEHEGTQKLVVLAESPKPDSGLLARIQEGVQLAAGLPAEVVVLPPRTLPKTPSGKIRRQESKQRYLSGNLRPPKFGWKSLLQTWGARLLAAPPKMKTGIRGAWCWSWLLKGWFDLVVRDRPVGPTVRSLLRRLGITVKVKGQPFGGGPLMVVANHASLLDSLILMACWEGEPLKFVMGESSARHPLLGRLAKSHLPVRRGIGQAEQALGTMTAALEKGDCLAVFPEGGIEFASGLRGFAIGPFQACAQAAARLQPVAISGSRQVLSQGQWVAYPGTVEVQFLDVIQAPQGDFQEATSLLREARSAIAQSLPEHCWETRLSRRD